MTTRGRKASSSDSTGSCCSSTGAGGATILPTLKQQEHIRLSQQEGSNCRQPTPLGCFLNALTRKKPLDCRTDTKLNRCLNLLDLTALGKFNNTNSHSYQATLNLFPFQLINLVYNTHTGVGSTLGLGLYVLAGQVASNKAGPAVVVSFALAALASAFSALCYAEFAGRVPRAGSAYAYSYITVGEFVAFVIGWNLILEYVIGASSVARGFSGYLRFVCQHVAINLGLISAPSTIHELLPPGTETQSINNMTRSQSINNQVWSANSTAQMVANSTIVAAGAEISSQSSRTISMQSIADYIELYFDWPSVAVILVLTIFILIGVKESTHVTFAFTALNLLVVLVVVISSLSWLDLKNWQLTKSQVPVGFGEGGFLPYGWSGVLAGSATCFFGFIGFDTIASSAEEAKNPKKNVPLSILLSLFISFIAYMAIAIVQTLLWPYYDQNNVTILPYIFDKLQMPITYWVVLVGAIAGLASSQLGGMYPLPRILYSMAHDKLIYSSLADINKKLKLPVKATIVGSVFIATLACLLDIQDLADMVSIGTLAAYSLVSLSVLILRYEDRSDAVDDSTIISNHLSFTDILSTMEQSTIDQQQQQHQQPEHEMQLVENYHQLRGIEASETKTNKTECDAEADANNNNDNNKTNGLKCKLKAKPSIPIREKGSKAVTAQLSVGFNSWFKSSAHNQHNDNNLNNDTIMHQEEKATQVSLASNKNNNSNNNLSSKKNLSYLDLLITWKASDQLKGQQMPPTNESSHKSKILISIIVILSILLDIVALCLTTQAAVVDNSTPTTQQNDLNATKLLLYCSGCILFVLLATVMLMLSRLPTSQSVPSDVFQVPFVPLIPTLSIFVNTFLMLNLSYLTWVRFTVWMAFGLFIYFTYGIWNSEGYLLYLDR